MATIFVMTAFAPAVNNINSSHENLSSIKSSPYIVMNETNLKSSFMLKSYKTSNNIFKNYVEYNLTFTTNKINTVNNIINIENKYGKVIVSPESNHINLTIILYNHGKTLKSKNLKINPEVSGGYDYCSNTYYKYPSGYFARLQVTKIEVSSLSLDTLPEIIAVFGEVVVTEEGLILKSIPDYIYEVVVPVFLSTTAALAADYALLYTDAVSNHEPAIYLDLGTSWGTQWYNFYRIGVYGEEGAFTGIYNSNHGTYVPIGITGGRNYSPNSPDFFAEYDPHSSVWNPYQEPPW